MNRLAHETSPYLLQHAHNPVDWYPWGESALQRAKAEDKPILVSIGYAACHWCHVMERESFEREEVAALMNALFVNIKIDREERPDLDHIYMDAVQTLTGSGGWPLNVFLTPDLKPFFGGTYFPPVSAYGRPSWKAVLEAVARSFREKRSDLEAEAERLTVYLWKAGDVGEPGHAGGARQRAAGPAGAVALKAVRDALMGTADREEGGFGPAPKFPQTFSIAWLIRYAHFTGDEESKAHACLSLDKLLGGGIYDHLGGGLARYSTDRRWLVPHFEKMLYDNALLVSVLCEAYAFTGLDRYRAAIGDILGFVRREWLSPEGGFYSAWDADSEGVEGKFYTWTRAEIEAVLGEEAAAFCRAYGVTEHGNWEGVNILERVGDTAGLEGARQRLLDIRNRRTRPLLDDKQILGWNALMNKAFAQAYAVTGEATYRETAVRHMEFILKAYAVPDGPGGTQDEGLGHVYKAGKVKHRAFLDDYACLIQALLHLQEITGDLAYALRAEALTEYVCAHFGDPGTGFFFYTHETQMDILFRKKEIYDGATPSGNSVMAWNLYYLGTLLDRVDWKERALVMLDAMMIPASGYPTSFGIWADLGMTVYYGWNEIVVTGKDFERLLSAVLRVYIPNRVIQSGLVENDHFPLLQGKITTASQAQIYLCRDFVCGSPLSDTRALQQEIQKLAQ